ncbi:MAG: RidA family protein [Acidimicrobiia bacterium]|nr:RidA family protein [Acidimicrobiia bacterium]
MERALSGSPFEAAYGFCRALRVDDRILVAGTAPIPQDGTPPPEDAASQADLCLHIIRAAIDELADDATVVRTRMFITDPADADDIGKVHGAHFTDTPPVATMVVVKELLDPRWKVEIEAEAVVGVGPPTRSDS